MNDDYDQEHAQAAQQASVNARNAARVAVRLPDTADVAWSAGLCDCWNLGNLCCNVYWCTPCMLGRNHTAVMEGVPDVMDCRVCVGLLIAGVVGMAGASYGTAASFGWVAENLPISFLQYVGYCAISGYTMWQRQQIRERYGISGDGCNDCLISWCCGACATGQHHMELSRRGVNPGSVCCEIAPPPAPAVAHQQPAYAVPQEKVHIENVYAQEEMEDHPQQ